MNITKNDFIAFLCYLSFCLTVLFGGFKQSIFVGLLSFIFLFFVCCLLFIVYCFVRKVMDFIFDNVVQPLHNVLQKCREDLDEIKKD